MTPIAHLKRSRSFRRWMVRISLLGLEWSIFPSPCLDSTTWLHFICSCHFVNSRIWVGSLNIWSTLSLSRIWGCRIFSAAFGSSTRLGWNMLRSIANGISDNRIWSPRKQFFIRTRRGGALLWRDISYSSFQTRWMPSILEPFAYLHN